MLCIFLRNNVTNKELKKYSQLELQIKKKMWIQISNHKCVKLTWSVLIAWIWNDLNLNKIYVKYLERDDNLSFSVQDLYYCVKVKSLKNILYHSYFMI